jgi:7-cyano-7-deazaguanine synthase
MASYGVTLLSGGLDSTTVTAYARTIIDHLTALTFYYGQSHRKEVECAQKIPAVMGIEHRLLDISFLGQVAWYSALTTQTSSLFPGQIE